MACLQAFKGWRYDPGQVDIGAVIAPPPSALTPEQQDQLYHQHPRNVVRLIRGRVLGGDSAQDNVGSRAAAHLDVWREEKLLIQDRLALYVLEQAFTHAGEDLVRRGFLCCVRLVEFGQEGLQAHEQAKGDDAPSGLDGLRALRGQTDPLMGVLSDDEGEILEMLGDIVDYEPLAVTALPADVTHRIWVVDSEDRVQQLLDACASKSLALLDDRCRYAAAMAYRTEVREAMQNAGRMPPDLGALASDYALMLVVPETDPGLRLPSVADPILPWVPSGLVFHLFW